MIPGSYYVQLRVTYRLNEQYIPESVYAYEHACGLNAAYPFLNLIPVCTFLLGLIVTVVVALLVFGPRRSDSPPGKASGKDERNAG